MALTAFAFSAAPHSAGCQHELNVRSHLLTTCLHPPTRRPRGDTATVGGGPKQVKGAQSETSEVLDPADAAQVDAEMLRANTAILNTEREIQIEGGVGPAAQGEHGQRSHQGNALQLLVPVR